MRSKSVFMICLILAALLSPPLLPHAAIADHAAYAGPMKADEDKAGNTGKGAAESPEGARVLYMVMLVVLIIWLGLAAYLFLIDRKVSRLERRLHE